MARRAAKKIIHNPWLRDQRKSCLGCGGYDDVHDVDFKTADSEIPYRSRLCRHCRIGREITFDRGDVNEGIA